jgi:PAS domain S-box-containing protein
MREGGRVVWVASQAEVVMAPSPDGGRPLLVGALVDVTERRHVESALRESEARLRAVFSSIDEGFCLCEMVLDGDGHPVDYRFLEVNPLFEAMTGLADAAGRTAKQLVPALEDRWVQTYAEVALGGQARRFEEASPAMGRSFSVFAVPVEPTGRFALVFSDVTERRQSEAMLRVGAANDAYRVALTDALRAAGSDAEQLSAAVDLLATHVGADRVMWAESRPSSHPGAGAPPMLLRASWSGPGMIDVAAQRAVLEGFGPAMVDAMTAGRAVVSGDITAEGLDAEAMEAFGRIDVVAHITVPLVREGRLVALLGVHQSTPRAWTHADVGLVAETAERVWSSVEAARARAAERRARERAELLADVVGQLEAVRGVGARARRLLELLVPTVAPGAAIEVRAAAGEPLRIEAGSGRGSAPVMVPIDAGDTRGELWFPGRRSLVEEWSFLVEVGARVGLLLENARLLEQEHDIALRLQRALLPERLVSHEGIAVAARYEAGSDGLEVGGDWYDSYLLPDGTVVLTVGDVVGHGLDAAAAMGRLRTALSTLAQRCSGPAQLLDHLDEFMATSDGVSFATALVAFFDPPTGVLRYCSAGHPPGLVRSAAGETRWLPDGRGLPLIGRRTDRTEGVTTLEPDDLVVLYSDGLVERRNEVIDDGLDRLRHAVIEVGEQEPEVVCSALVDRLCSLAPGGDDVVVLCLRVLATDVQFHLALPAEPPSVARTRAAARRWLAQRGVGEDQQIDALLAIGEAVANAVEHGMAAHGSGTVQLSLADRSTTSQVRIDVEVSDTGVWREAGPGRDRGHGTGIMQRLTRAFERTSGPPGTTVTFTLAWVRRSS